jgi:hypothetical protein
MARHPNQVSPYGPLRTIKGKQVRPEPINRKGLQERDLKALEEMQAKRSLKPPGRR